MKMDGNDLIGFGLFAWSAILVTLKLMGKITISWWWALAPIWIPAVFTILVLIVVIVFFKNLLKNSKKLSKYQKTLKELDVK